MSTSVTIKPPPVLKATLTDAPTLLTCPYCTDRVTTLTRYQFGAFTFMSVGCFASCFLCCIPCFVDFFKDVKHECPKCGSQVGIFGRIGNSH